MTSDDVQLLDAAKKCALEAADQLDLLSAWGDVGEWYSPDTTIEDWYDNLVGLLAQSILLKSRRAVERLERLYPSTRITVVYLDEKHRSPVIDLSYGTGFEAATSWLWPFLDDLEKASESGPATPECVVAASRVYMLAPGQIDKIQQRVVDEWRGALDRIEAASRSSPPSTPDRAIGHDFGQEKKRGRILLPRNDDVTRLAKFIRDNEDTGETMLAYALQFAGGDEKQANNLYDQLRKRFRHLLDGTRFEKKG